MNRSTFFAIPVLAFAALLAACGSNVKLDDVPVENRTGASVSTPSSSTSTSAATGVAPVEIAGSNSGAAGPAGVGKVIYFDYDSFTIKPEFQAVIEAHARYMAGNKTRKLAVEGHTDDRGGREYNLALGQKRAEAVRRAMGLLGVTDAQVEAVSFGKEKPAVAGADEAAFAKNRRAELTYR